MFAQLLLFVVSIVGFPLSKKLNRRRVGVVVGAMHATSSTARPRILGAVLAILARKCLFTLRPSQCACRLTAVWAGRLPLW